MEEEEIVDVFLEDLLKKKKNLVDSQADLFPGLTHSTYVDGKDEMNLAEFPIATITNRVDPDMKTLIYTDETFDAANRIMVKRQLTITASDRYGLPTATDDEVILGLVQLTRMQGFLSNELAFSRYQLVQVLGWQPTTKNYRRLEDALNRWIGVTLYYEKAWRDKSTNEWVNANFHILDNVRIYKKDDPLDQNGNQGKCYIKWNDHIFKNFQAGNLKSLDFGIYRNLTTPIAKRIFRFLDKRFKLKAHQTFDLEIFAFEKIGISKSYSDTAQLKRRMAPAIKELEDLKFIEPMSADERYQKKTAKKWTIRFTKYSGEVVLPMDIPSETAVERRLTDLGVSSKQAAILASTYPENFLMEKMDIVEYLRKAKGGVASLDNPAGFLVKSIKEDWKSPPGFKNAAQREEEAKRDAFRKSQKSEAAAIKREQEAKELEEQKLREARVNAYLSTLSEEDREKLANKAMKKDKSALLFSGEGALAQTYRQICLEEYVLNMLDKKLGQAE